MGEVKFDIPLWNMVVQHQVQQVQDMNRRGNVTINLAVGDCRGCGVWDLVSCSAEEINSLAGTKAVVMCAVETEVNSFVLVCFGIACSLYCC